VNGKERVFTMLSGKTPDRVALFEKSVYASVGSKILGRPALTGGTTIHRDEAEAWLKSDAAHDEFIERMYADYGEIVRLLGYDCIKIPWRMAARPTRKLSEFDYLYGDIDGDSWQIMRYDPQSEHCGIVDSASRRRGIDELRRDVKAAEKALARAGASEPDGLLKRLVGDYGNTHAVIGGVSVTIPLDENWLLATAIDPGLVAASLDVQVEYALRDAKAQADLGIRLLLNGGDLADNRGPIYGPKVFREIYLPRLKRLTDALHALGCWCAFTSDGNLWQVAEMMFDEAGIDCYGEIDWTAGMDLAELKPRFPRVTYWGNVPTSLIQNGTRKEVLDAARHCIESVDDRRLILGSSNAILPGSPVENVFALKEAAETWGSR
jgi:hypothetical protein